MRSAGGFAVLQVRHPLTFIIMRLNMEHKSVTSERGQTHYWIERCGGKNSVCVVFTHGLTADHTMFEKQEEFFSKDYTYISWDIPLHGKSRPYKDFSFENCAKELNSIFEAEGISRAVLVGMSLGGYPVQEFAVRFPEKVLGFIALDTTPYGLGYYSKTDLLFLKRAGAYTRPIPDGFLRKWIAKASAHTKYSFDLMLRMLKPLSKDEICEQIEISYGAFLKENRDVKYDFPVLILLGEYDHFGKVSVYSKIWAQQEGYPLHIIKNAAHLSNADNPQEVNREIDAFISQIQRNNERN